MTSWFAWFVTGAGSKALGKCTWISKNACPIGIGQLPPRKMKKQEIEIYLQDHYQTQVKPLVDAETNRQIKIEGKPWDKASKLKLLKTDERSLQVGGPGHQGCNYPEGTDTAQPLSKKKNSKAKLFIHLRIFSGISS